MRRDTMVRPRWGRGGSKIPSLRLFVSARSANEAHIVKLPSAHFASQTVAVFFGEGFQAMFATSVEENPVGCAACIVVVAEESV